MVSKVQLFCIVFILSLYSHSYSQSAQEYYEQGLALKIAGQYEEAIKIFDKAIRKNRKLADAHYQQALCYMTKDSPTARIRAEYALEKALDIEKDNPDYLYEMGNLLLKKTFFLDSRRFFEKSLEIDPDFHDARFALATANFARRSEKTFGGKKNVENAISELKILLEKKPDYPGVYYFLGRAYDDIEKYKEAEKALLKQLELDPDHYKSKTLLGSVYYNFDMINKATEYYYKAIDGYRTEDGIEELYRDLKPLLNDSEKSEYKNTPLEERSAFISRFWHKKDPNHMTLENERLVEHFRRLKYIKSVYHENNTRGYDDRGLIYLKFGEPRGKYIDIKNSNESWLYSRIDFNLAFDFLSAAGGAVPYNIVPDFYMGKVSHPINQLYLNRAYLGGIYAILGGRAMGFKMGGINRDDLLRTIAFDYNMPRTEAIANNPPENFFFEFDETPIDFPFDLAQFKGRDGRTDLELYMGFPHDQFVFSGPGPILSADIESKIIVLDSTYFRRAELNKNRTLRVSDAEMDMHTVGMETLRLSPGDYIVGIQQKQPSANLLGIYQPEVTIRNFNSDKLMVSDIRFGTGEMPADFVEDRQRDNLKMQPYPFSNITKTDLLLLYFEIYNLNFDMNRNTRYTLTYSVTKKELNISGVFGGLVERLVEVVTRDPGNILISTDRIGSLPEVHELIALDLSSLDESDMTITVQIEDKVSGETATISKNIKIVK